MESAGSHRGIFQHLLSLEKQGDYGVLLKIESHECVILKYLFEVLTHSIQLKLSCWQLTQNIIKLKKLIPNKYLPKIFFKQISILRNWRQLFLLFNLWQNLQKVNGQTQGIILRSSVCVGQKRLDISQKLIMEVCPRVDSTTHINSQFSILPREFK